MKKVFTTLALVLCALTAKAQIDSLRHVVLDSTAYVGERFRDPKYQVTETITFTGYVGHIDGWVFKDMPKLKKVIFKCPVFSTGGPIIAEDCPEFEEIVFERLVGFSSYLDCQNCPKFKRIKFKSALIEGKDETKQMAKSFGEIRKDKKIKSDLLLLLNLQTEVLQKKQPEIIVGISAKIGKYAILPALDSLGIEAAEYRAAVEKEAINFNPDEWRNKLEILRESAPYAKGEYFGSFSYAEPFDSLLTLTRKHFNLDSIAGNGCDVERIKNLLYWIHDLVRHDGNSPWPDCNYNLRELFDVCQKENRGLNCRFMAFILTEALLAEGIPARYLTCQSRAYDKDYDCHVICVAWAESLHKWIWVDPTFAAYVTDENGLLLHPGEVRQRLIDGKPLVLNPDANWNHENVQTKEQYLEKYMAKNLYIITSRFRNEAEPEGFHKDDGKFVSLVPTGFDFKTNFEKITTSDYDQFWAAPKK